VFLLGLEDADACVLETVFNRAGIEVGRTPSLKALQAIERTPQQGDLVFMVCDNGIEREALKFLHSSQVKSIAVCHRKPTVQGLKMAGFSAFLVKPIDPEQVAHLVRRIRERIISDREEIPIRVLLADDAQVNRMLVGRVLRNLGVEVDEVTNGRDAVEAFRQNPYALILMDCEMPVMDGFDASKKIRALSEARTPIIAMTGHKRAEDRRHCREAGMDDFVSKPINVEKIRSILERWAK
jgi:CheY-like chemotaxis protein